MDLKENASQYSNVASMWDKKWGHISNKWVQIIKNNDLIENKSEELLRNELIVREKNNLVYSLD